MRSPAAAEESQREGEGEAGKGFQQELARRLKGHKPWSPQSWTLMPTLPDWPWDPSKALSLSLPQFPLLQNEDQAGGRVTRCEVRCCQCPV